MAGSIGYVSFPHFKPRKRKSVMSSLSTMCLQLKASLPTFSRFRKCFSRPSKTLKATQNDASSRECLLPGPNDDDDGGSWSSTESGTSSPTNEERTTLSTFPPLVQSHSIRLAIKTSTRDQSPAASFRSATNRLRAGLTRRLTWRSEISKSEEPTDESSADDEASAELRRASSRDLIADLDALALSQQDLELLRRMERVSRAASASPHRRRLMREPSGYWGDGFGSDVVESQPRLRLRGGGGDDDVPFRGPCRRTTLPQRPPKAPLPDDARPSRSLWWLAGGMGRPPKYGGLRVSKEVEVVNRELVGFVGTLFGIRKVGKVGILPQEGSGVDGGDSGDKVAAGDAVMTGARGGSLKGSSLGKGLDAEDPGIGSGSVKSAPGMSEAGSVRSGVTGVVNSPGKSTKSAVGDGVES